MKRHRAWRAIAATLGGVLACAAIARADDSPDGKGIAGGALLGAELTLAAESFSKVEPSWAYLVGGPFAAAAGGTAGYFVEKNAYPEVSSWLFAGGLVLVLPTLLWIMRAQDAPPPRAPVARPALRLGALAWAPPTVDVRPTFSPRELNRYHFQQRPELRVTLFSACFE